MHATTRFTGALCAIAVLLLTAACTSVSSVRQLDETSAKGLIQGKLEKQPLKIRVNNMSQLMVMTLRDYKTSVAHNNYEAALKRLLERNLVSQSVETKNYPVISGAFIERESTLDGPRTGMYRLQMSPDSNVLAGEFSVTGFDDLRRQKTSGYRVQGSVQPDGKLVLSREGWTTCDQAGAYVEEGSVAYLELIHCPIGTKVRWQGPASGKRVNVKWYTYSWAPDFQKQLLRDEGGLFAVGGGIDVERVTALRLTTETEATAEFTWKASLNDTGRTFVGSMETGGQHGTVAFGRKPDGTWFVDQLSIPGQIDYRVAG
ncbi:MAG: hypothetical protein ABSE79_03105 [Terriglobia bacterium]|jgi:hypothetical protein